MKREFWNDTASKGAILGALMLVSHIFEQMFVLSGSLTRLSIVGVEMLVAAAVYLWLMWRFAKNAANKFGDDTLGFGYGQALLYIMYVSLFAGIIVGLGGYLYIHYAVGYSNYIDRLAEMYSSILASAQVPSSLGGVYGTMINELRSQSEPNVLNTVVSSMVSYAFTGVFAGLFIAAGVKRQPQIFGDKEKTEDDDDE